MNSNDTTTTATTWPAYSVQAAGRRTGWVDLPGTYTRHGFGSDPAARQKAEDFAHVLRQAGYGARVNTTTDHD